MDANFIKSQKSFYNFLEQNKWILEKRKDIGSFELYINWFIRKDKILSLTPFTCPKFYSTNLISHFENNYVTSFYSINSSGQKIFQCLFQLSYDCHFMTSVNYDYEIHQPFICTDIYTWNNEKLWPTLDEFAKFEIDLEVKQSAGFLK